MELFGLICAVVGVGTLSMGFMCLVSQVDEVTKKDRTRREAGYGLSTKRGTQ